MKSKKIESKIVGGGGGDIPSPLSGIFISIMEVIQGLINAHWPGYS
jgi:hypothetical protein